MTEYTTIPIEIQPAEYSQNDRPSHTCFGLAEQVKAFGRIFPALLTVAEKAPKSKNQGEVLAMSYRFILGSERGKL